MIKKEQIVNFSAALYQELSPTCLSVMDPEDLKKFCYKQIDDLKELEEERVVKLEDGREVWLGLRFYAMNAKLPFAQIYKSWTGLTKQDVALISELAKKEFSKIELKGMTFNTRHDLIKPHKEVLDERDMHWVFGRLNPQVKSTLRFEKQTDMSVMDSLYKSYEDYYEDFPHYKEFLGEVDEIDMKESLDSGQLYKIFLNDEWCGVLAGYEDIFADQKAFYVSDEVLFRKFRGKGLGIEIQKGIHQLGLSHGMKYVYGTILEKNVPSLKIATRSGRKIVFGKYFLPF